MTLFSGWPCLSQYACISFLRGAFFLHVTAVASQKAGTVSGDARITCRAHPRFNLLQQTSSSSSSAGQRAGCVLDLKLHRIAILHLRKIATYCLAHLLGQQRHKNQDGLTCDTTLMLQCSVAPRSGFLSSSIVACCLMDCLDQHTLFVF